MESEDMNQDTGKIGYILIINSDPMMRQKVSGYFSDHNFPTGCASNWSELKYTGTAPCLIILDQPLGLNDGLDGLRSIRSKADIPVIMTGDRSDEIDRIICLELGADDYIVGPAPGSYSHVPAPSCGDGRWRASRARAIRKEAATGSMAGGSSVVHADWSTPTECRFR
jgi:CheY-like chemotaxis protein